MRSAAGAGCFERVQVGSYRLHVEVEPKIGRLYLQQVRQRVKIRQTRVVVAGLFQLHGRHGDVHVIAATVSVVH